MPPELNPAWEYHAGDPEIEEFLAEQEGRARLGPFARLYGDLLFADNPGVTVRNKAARPRTPGGVTRETLSVVAKGALAVLRAHGPQAVTAVKMLGRLPCQTGTIRAVLIRNAGRAFKLAGWKYTRKNAGPAYLWAAVTDAERDAFLAGRVPVRAFLTPPMPQWAGQGWRECDPFVWAG